MIDTLWKPRRSLIAFFFLASAAGLIFIITADLSNGASESSMLFGLSGERLALVGGMLTISMVLGALALQIFRGKSFGFATASEKTYRKLTFLGWATLLIFLLAWCLTWIPSDRFGSFYYYLARLYPFVVWLMCFSGAGLLLLIAQQFGLNTKHFVSFVREQRQLLIVMAIALTAFALIAFGISFRVVSIFLRYEEDFWYGAGVPVLALQGLVAMAVSLTLTLLAKKFATNTNFEKYRPDLIFFIVIWAITAILWAREPVGPDFFITKPTAPNYELYPDYDAKFFDLFSQFALIGQGLDNGSFFDRPLYSAFLVYLHSLFEQNYPLMMAWQAALFAVLPALGYILGRQLHSRAAGAGLAALLALRGINAIQLGPFINTAHQKQMMTDFPTAVLMLLITILLIRWLREPSKNWTSLIWAAGVVGLATLLRPHPLIYIPTLIALILWVYRRQKRLWFIFSTATILAVLAGILPWVVGNGHGQSVFDLYLQKIRNVIDTRYPDLHIPGLSSAPTAKEIAATDAAAFYFIDTADVPNPKSILLFGLDHLLNNLNTSFQVLPFSPYYQDLRYTVRTSENFWKPYWNGTISPWGRVFLPFNLILLALGLAAAYKRARWLGLVPLLVMFAYHVMNSLARTSGGRYIVPVDWVFIAYYFLGILTLLEFISALFSTSNLFNQAPTLSPNLPIVSLNRTAWARMVGVLFSFIVIGALIPLSASFFPQRYPTVQRQVLVQQVIKTAGKTLGFSSKDWKAFLSSPDAVVTQGRILYPRQFDKDEGAKFSIYNFYLVKPYPRTLFTLIGPNGEQPAIFASMKAPTLPNATDAILLACRESNYIQVWAILLNDGTLIKRTPASAATSLTCPLQEPICDNNHHCR